MGDHLNDADSINKLVIKNSIKIGFLNSKDLINSSKDYNLYDDYSNIFDIGIMNDGTLNHVNNILCDIFANFKKEVILKEFEKKN